MAGEAGGARHIRADTLARLLAELPAGAVVACNAIGNLTIVSAGGVYIGFIDLLAERVELWESKDKEGA